MYVSFHEFPLTFEVNFTGSGVSQKIGFAEISRSMLDFHVLHEPQLFNVAHVPDWLSEILQIVIWEYSFACFPVFLSVITSFIIHFQESLRSKSLRHFQLAVNCSQVVSFINVQS